MNRRVYFLLAIALIAIMFAFILTAKDVSAADTNTVSSTVVTDKSVPTASAPSVVVNNSDVCKSAAAASVQTQVLGFATGITITDENCERIKLARSLYGMGMKVAAISTLCMDPRVFDAMWMAGTPCPFMGSIGNEARDFWEKNTAFMPEGSDIKVVKELEIAAIAASLAKTELQAKKDAKELAKQTRTKEIQDNLDIKKKLKQEKAAAAKALRLEKAALLKASREKIKNERKENGTKRPWAIPLTILTILLL